MYGHWKRPFSGGAVQSATHHIEVIQLSWNLLSHDDIYVYAFSPFTVQQELQGEMPQQALWRVPYRSG